MLYIKMLIRHHREHFPMGIRCKGKCNLRNYKEKPGIFSIPMVFINESIGF